jgi:hypothetical protein
MAGNKSIGPTARVGATVLAALGAFSAIGYVIDKSHAWATRVFVRAAKDGVSLPKGDYLLSWPLLFISASAVGCAIWLAIRYWLVTKDKQDDLAARSKIREEYKAVCDAIQKVVYQTYNPANPTQAPIPRITFKKIECEFTINAKGDTRVVQTYEIETADKAAHFWIVKTVSDSYAAPLDVLSDISFKTESQTVGTGLEAVPIDMRGNHRSIALFFLPEMQPRAARAFKVMYAWNGWFGELFGPGQDTNWEWSYQSADPNNIADVTFSFVFDPACGDVCCENVQTPMPGETLLKTQQNGVVWTYRNPTAPVGRLNWILRFRQEA